MKLALSCLVCSVAALAAGTEAKTKLPTARADLLQGQKLFNVHCAVCHGPKGEGLRGPTLARARLRRAPDDEALVHVLQNGIRGTEMPGAGAMSEKEVRQVAAYVRSLGKIPAKAAPGDAAHGAEIYRGKGGCTACHSIHGDAGIEGPDLAGIGDSRSIAFLRQSIVDPNAAVPEDYLLVTVVPANGPRVTGVRVNEDSFSIQVRDNAGRIHSFWKKDVTQMERQRGKSSMPSYQGKLTETEITDLVAYLASLKEEK